MRPLFDQDRLIDLYPATRQEVSAEEYLEIMRHRKREVKSTRFIPPTTGKSGFGRFQIEWKRPRYARTG